MSTHIVAGLEVGTGHPTRFVAEISNNHNRSIDRAFRLIEAAKNAGADFVKFQCYTPDELVTLRGDGPAPDPWGSDGWSMRDLYEQAQTPHAWFPELVACAESFGIPWFSSVFGRRSLELLESLGCPCYKIAALDSGSVALHNLVRATGKPTITSTRVFDPRYGPQLYCPPGYPQTDIRLRNLRNGFLGFSYHGTETSVPFTAALVGASLIEIHLELEAERSELESDVSLTEVQLSECIGAVRRVYVQLLRDDAEAWL